MSNFPYGHQYGAPGAGWQGPPGAGPPGAGPPGAPGAPGAPVVQRKGAFIHPSRLPPGSAPSPAAPSPAVPAVTPSILGPRPGLAQPPSILGAPGAPAGTPSNSTTNNMPGDQKEERTLPPGWLQFKSPEGKPYYQNIQTKEVTWVFPADKQKKWQKVTTPDGKTYYFNQVTRRSVWEEPEDIDALIDDQDEDADLKFKPKLSTDKEEFKTVVSDIAKTVPHSAKYATEEEATEAFVSLLREKKIPPGTEWKDALKLIVFDERYKAFTSQKKRLSIFEDYMLKRTAEAAEEEKQKAESSKANFQTMLEECKDITGSSRFRDVEPLLKLDPRWSQIEDRRTREDMVYDFIDALARKEREEKEKKTRALLEKYRVFLQKQVDEGVLTASTQFRLLQDKFNTMEEYKEFATDLEPKILQNVCYDFIRDLRAKERDRIELEKAERRKREKEARSAFRELLQESSEALKFHAKSRFKEFRPHVEDDARFQAMEALHQTDVAKDLFDDFCEDLADDIHDHKKQLKELMRSRQISLSHTDTVQTVLPKIADAAELKDVKPYFVSIILCELIDRVKYKHEQRQRKLASVKKSFMQLLHKRVPPIFPGLVNNPIPEDQLWLIIKVDPSVSLAHSSSTHSKLSEAERYDVFLEFVREMRNPAPQQPEQKDPASTPMEVDSNGSAKKRRRRSDDGKGSGSDSRSRSRSRSSHKRHKRDKSSSPKKRKSKHKHKHKDRKDSSSKHKKHRKSHKKHKHSRSRSRSPESVSSG